MTERRGGLGRGLAALIPTGPPDPADAAVARSGVGNRAADVVIGQRSAATRTAPRATSRPDDAPEVDAGSVAGAVYREVRVDGIRANPRQPRTVFDEEALAELEHSVREFGLLQPIVVRELDEPVPGEAGVEVTHELVMG